MASPTIAGRIECVVQAADVLGETPLWCDRSQRLWWIDIERQLHQSFDPATGSHEVRGRSRRNARSPYQARTPATAVGIRIAPDLGAEREKAVGLTLGEGRVGEHRGCARL